VDALNHQSVDELTGLMTEDHVFIDSLGTRFEGRDMMKTGWAGYFSMVPDYTITIEETYSDGPVVVMLGTAQGTCSVDGRLLPGNRWETPAAWRALIRGSLVAGWRVYADNEPIRQLVMKNRKQRDPAEESQRGQPQKP
jgi:ketosteroid isomerase-like protein